MLRSLFGASLCAMAPAAFVEDNSALVQEAVRTHQQASSERAGLGRHEMLAGLAAEQWPQLHQAPQQPQQKLPEFKLPEFKLPKLKLPELKLPKMNSEWQKPFDCGKHPLLCKPPFNCQNWNIAEHAKYLELGVAADGKANLRMWCAFPSYDKYMDTCLVQKDPVKAAQIQYTWAKEQQNGIDDMDASYCFIEGHCTNALVTNETTLEDTYEMCDSRFQRTHWTSFGSLAMTPLILSKMDITPQDWSEGVKDPVTSRLFVQAACAMGNFHCDVMMCKETYCKDPRYVRKFGHLLPKAPGHLIQHLGYIE